jgi:hypothetical protein
MESGDTQMNVGVVHYYPRAWVGNGGCSSAVRRWASGLAETGAQVTVVGDGKGASDNTLRALAECAAARTGLGAGAVWLSAVAHPARPAKAWP